MVSVGKVRLWIVESWIGGEAGKQEAGALEEEAAALKRKVWCVCVEGTRHEGQSHHQPAQCLPAPIVQAAPGWSQ